MRRKEKEITSKDEIMSILKEADICRIALCDNGQPYIIPMNFGVCEDALFMHSACEGRKIDIIKANNRVCFEAETKTELVSGDIPCKFGMKYYSVIGNGKAYILQDKEDIKRGLDCIMRKYSDDDTFEYDDKILDRVLIIKIEIESITGKKSGY